MNTAAFAALAIVSVLLVAAAYRIGRAAEARSARAMAGLLAELLTHPHPTYECPKCGDTLPTGRVVTIGPVDAYGDRAATVVPNLSNMYAHGCNAHRARP